MIPVAVALAVLAANEPIRIAAPGLTMVNIEPAQTPFYTSHLSQQINFQGVRVVTASDLAGLLGFERQQQLMGCADDACKAQVSATLGMDGLLLGQVARVGKAYKLDVKVLAPLTGQPLAAASAASESQDGLLNSFTLVAENIARQLSERLGRPLMPGATDVITRWSTAKKMSWVPTGIGVAAVAAGTVSLLMARGQYNQLTATRQVDAEPGSPQAPLTPNQAAAYAQAGQTQQTIGWTAVGVGAGLIAAGTALFIFGGDEVVSTGVTVAPGGASFGFAGVW